MDLVPNVMLSEFRDEVRKHLITPTEENKYKYQVGLQLRAYRVEHLRTAMKGKNVDPWPKWIEGAEKGIDVEKADAMGLKRSTVNSLSDSKQPGKQGKLIRAIAAHYRLHMHLYEDHLKYARALDDYLFMECPYPFDGPIFTVAEKNKTEGGLYEPTKLVEIEDAGWTQAPEGSEAYELAVRVRYNVMHRIHEGRDLQYGLKQSMMRIVPENFEITREYCSYLDQMPGSYVKDGQNRWLSTAPLDNYKMLRGTSVAGPICVAEPASSRTASLTVDVFARSSEFALSITDLASKSKICADDIEKANLIEKVFAVYINKRNQIDDEHVLLGSTEVTI